MQSTQKNAAMGGLLIGLLIGLGATIIYYLVKAKNAVTTTAKNTLTALTSSLSDIPTHETASVALTATQIDAVLKSAPLNPVRLYLGEVFDIPTTLKDYNTPRIQVIYKNGVLFKVVGRYQKEVPMPAVMGNLPDGTTGITHPAYIHYSQSDISTEQQVIDLLFKKKDYIISRVFLDSDEYPLGGAEAFVVYTDGTAKRLAIVDKIKSKSVSSDLKELDLAFILG